eukprot:6198406-Pleurochrysis_carterae.AAC.2
MVKSKLEAADVEIVSTASTVAARASLPSTHSSKSAAERARRSTAPHCGEALYRLTPAAAPAIADCAFAGIAGGRCTRSLALACERIAGCA